MWKKFGSQQLTQQSSFRLSTEQLVNRKYFFAEITYGSDLLMEYQPTIGSQIALQTNWFIAETAENFIKEQVFAEPLNKGHFIFWGIQGPKSTKSCQEIFLKPCLIETNEKFRSFHDYGHFTHYWRVSSFWSAEQNLKCWANCWEPFFFS